MDQIYPVLVGIIAGFILNTFWQTFKDKLKRKQKLNQISEELRSNINEIPQKRDHINKIINYLNQNKILPGYTVEFITTFYSNYLKELYPYLSALERNSLHVIYQYFDKIDNTMSNFENEIKQFLSMNIMKEPREVYAIYIIRFQELLNILSITEKLINKHLDGKPEDVFYINRKIKPDKFK